MSILTLHTGLFEDGDIIIKATEATVVDLREDLNDEAWDTILDQILDADLIVTA